MDDYYYDYFKRRATGAEGMPRISNLEVREIRRLIGNRKNWREDAYYFLIYNIHMMLIAPLRKQSGNQWARINNMNIQRMIRDDVDLIARTANRVSYKRRSRYVSSTSIAVALGLVADELKTSAVQVWGPKEKKDGKKSGKIRA